MTFSNPANGAREFAPTYTTALLEVLGEKDPMEVLATTPKAVRTLATSVDDRVLRTPERPGKWSMLQVAQHLADTELIYGCRYRMPIAEDEPVIHAFDQDRWAQRLWRGFEPLDFVIEQFSMIRSINLRFLRFLTPEQWERVGMHVERGPESVRHMVNLAAAHDMVHMRQMARIRETLGRA